eukprot:scpid42134/ scgid35529/ Glycine--tRNA ligase; Diadenosine tetraphosphate synthetase; Glycyl-tRNA synthetase
MASASEDPVDALRAAVKEQGDLVQSLKKSGAPKADVTAAVNELKVRKRALEKEISVLEPQVDIDRKKFDAFLASRYVYCPTAEIYNGIAGLYNMGATGAQMEDELLSLWKSYFLRKERLQLVRCPVLNPDTVLRVSGHEERFIDVMVKDMETGACYRADHLLAAHLEKLIESKKSSAEEKEAARALMPKVEALNKQELGEQLTKFGVKVGERKDHAISEPLNFNLMFSTMVGPGGQEQKVYLRPETAQGIFLDFKRLYQNNNERLPFGACQIGSAYRNEISPRNGLIRQREFLMAELEYFVLPNQKTHANFASVRDLEVCLLSAEQQMTGQSARRVKLGEALQSGVIRSEIMAYFIGRIALFLMAAGIRKEMLRFRQHMDNEMAHYACDCWDGECRTSIGWVECVGCADRSDFDLKLHSAASKTSLCAQVRLKEPQSVDVVEVCTDKKVMGKAFRGDEKVVTPYLHALQDPEAAQLEESLATNGSAEVTIEGKSFTVKPEHIKSVKRFKKDIYEEKIFPHVIEPSFGISRILHAILEQNFQVRPEDAQRTWLSLPAAVCPVKCAVLPLSNKEEFTPFLHKLSEELTDLNLANLVDDSSSSIGRRYARMDEIGVPFDMTVDFATLTADTVTLRERNTTKQLRVPVSKVSEAVDLLCRGKASWDDMAKVYPEHTSQEDEKASAAATANE